LRERDSLTILMNSIINKRKMTKRINLKIRKKEQKYRHMKTFQMTIMILGI
jgi:hypothetical protein